MNVFIVVLTPVLSIAFVLADPFIKVLLTDKWIEVVPFFRILCVTSLLFPVHLYNLHIINVKGRSDLNLRLEIIKVVLSAIVLIAAMQFGMYALLYASVFMSIICVFINSAYSKMFIDYGIMSQLKDISPIVLYGMLASISVWMLNSMVLNNASDIFKLVAGVIVGSATYLSILYLVNPAFFSIIKKLRHD